MRRPAAPSKVRGSFTASERDGKADSLDHGVMRGAPFLDPGRDGNIAQHIIRLVFDGTSGPMRFELARTEMSMRESLRRRDDRPPPIAR